MDKKKMEKLKVKSWNLFLEEEKAYREYTEAKKQYLTIRHKRNNVDKAYWEATQTTQS